MLSFVFRFVLGSVKRGKHLYSPTPLCFFWFVFSFRWTKWSECFWDNSRSRVQQRACYAWKLNMYQQKWWGPSSKETCWPVKFIANFWSKDLSQMKKKNTFFLQLFTQQALNIVLFYTYSHVMKKLIHCTCW